MKTFTDHIRRIWERLRELAYPRCPKCGGRIESIYDPSQGRYIHICSRCYKEWL